MEIEKSYITDKEGSIKSVVIDIDTFKNIEEILIDHGLAKAMIDVEDDDTISVEEAKLLLNQ